MSEPDISTLARRLAEQNNVDWRVLRGSGPDGKVVERDVLDYLAKVMAGEEAINPTPEPVPEGMEAWPDQDIQGFRAGLGEAATLGELRDELGNASRDFFDEPVDEPSVADDVVAASANAVSGGGAEAHVFGGAPTDATDVAAPTGSEDGIDEDIFLFEDDDATLAGEPAETADFERVGSSAGGMSTPATIPDDAPPAADDLDELLVAGDDFDAVGSGDGDDAYATSSHDSRFGAVQAGYLGDGDSSDSHVGASDHDDSGAGYASAAAFTTEEEEAPVTAAAGTGWGDEISFGGDGGSAHEQAAAVPDLWGPEATARTADSDLWTGPTGASSDSFTDTHGVAGSEEEAAWPSDSLGAFTDSVESEAAASDTYLEQAEPPPATDTARDESVDVGLAAVGATLLSAGTATLPLARPGTILRRNIDVSALAAAQLAVGQELGFDEPLGASAFLLRAVVKAATSTGFSPGAVGLAVLEEGVTIKRVDGAADMSFSELVRLVGNVDAEEDEPVLVAADLSGLDVDEAVLELATPVISLGRILYDNQRGAYRSTLSLTGPMPLDTAAGLLARVAELLDAPVRLVL